MALSLKVYLVSSGQMKTMRFMQDMSIAEVAQQIQEKYEEGGTDHGIFQPEVSGKTAGRWLRMDRTLQFYDLNTGDEIHYKKKHRPLKVRLVDGTIKTIVVDESLNIQDIAESIGNRMAVGNPEEYSLKIEGSGEREWLNPTLSLHENNVSEDMVLVFKKKFFFNDANIDRSDPVQLHLVYVQSRDAILDGTHPTQKDEAVKLAAMQCQAEFGTFNPEKHSSKSLTLKNLLPPQWQKKKTIAQNIIKEYRKLANTDSENAKYRYIQMCRALKTYGITTFEVAKKIERPGQKKPKFEKLILGITRESIVLMNADTKEIEKTFPITHLKRWAPGNRTFTLDFGEYYDDYITVQTLEGDAISQLIAGYIDIILRRTKDAPRIAAQSKSKVAQEVSVAPIQAQATAFTTAPTAIEAINPQQVTSSMISPGMMMPQAQVGQMQPQMMTLESAIENVGQFLGTLHQSAVVPGDFQPQFAREEFARQSQAILQRGASLISGMSSGQVNIDQLAGDLSTEIADMIANAKMLANSSEQDVSLIPGAMAVSEAISQLLQCAKQVRDNPNDRQALMALKIAQTGLAAANLFMKNSQQGVLVTDDNKDLVLSSANVVAALTEALVAQSIQYADGNPKLLPVCSYTKALGDGVLYSARTLAPVMSSPECQQHVGSLAQSLAKSCSGLIKAFQTAGVDPNYVANLLAAAKAVEDAVSQLVTSTRSAKNPADEAVYGIIDAGQEIQKHSAVLLESTSPPEILTSYKAIASGTSSLVNGSKVVSQEQPHLQAKLLGAVKNLALATRSLLVNVQGAAKAPQDPNARNGLNAGTQKVLGELNSINSCLAQEIAYSKLRQVATLMAAKSTDLVSASARCHVKDEKQKASLNKNTDNTRLELIKLVGAIAQLSQSPMDKEYQAKLLLSARMAAAPTSQLVAFSKSCLKNVEDGNERKDLSDAGNAVALALQHLMDACTAVEEIGGGKEIKEVLEDIESYDADLNAQLMAAEGGFLTGMPGQNASELLNLLTFSVQELQKAVDNMQRCATKDQENVGECARSVGAQMEQVAHHSKELAAITRGKDGQKLIITSAQAVGSETSELLRAAKMVVLDPDNLDLVDPLNSSKDGVNQACVNLMNAARGINVADIDRAAEAILATLKNYRVGTGTSFTKQVSELKQITARIGATSSQLFSAGLNNPKSLGTAAKFAVQANAPLVDSVSNAVGLFNDQEVMGEILQAGKDVTRSLAELIKCAKRAAAQNDPQNETLKKAYSTIMDQLKDLMNAIKPGQSELNEAAEIINTALALLDSDEPLGVVGSAMPIWEMNQVLKKIATSAPNIMSSARSQTADLGSNSKQVAGYISDLVNTSRLLANPQETPCSIISSKILGEATSLLSTPEKTSQVNCTKNIATYTKEVIAAAKESRGTPEEKQILIKHAQALGGATAALGKAIKAMLTNQPGADVAVTQAGNAVKVRAEQLLRVSVGKQTVPPEVVMELYNYARAVGTASATLISSASSVSDDPTDAMATKELSTSAKSLTDAITSVQATANTLAPGAKEFTDANASLHRTAGELDAIGISVAAGVDISDKKPKDTSIQSLHESLVTSIRDLATVVQSVVKSSMEAPDQFPAHIKELEEAGVNTGRLSIHVVAATSDSKSRAQQIEGGKGVMSALINVLQKAKNVSVNPTDPDMVEELSDASQQVKDSISSLGSHLQGGMLILKECDSAIQRLRAVVGEMGVPAQRDVTLTYQDCQKQIKNATRLLANGLSELVDTGNRNPDQIGVASNELVELVASLCTSIRQAAAVTKQPEVQAQLNKNGVSVCNSALQMLETAKRLAENSNDARAKSNLSQGLSTVTASVSELLESVKLGAAAERDIEKAIEQISAIKSDLDQAALFAASGQFNVQLAQGANIENTLEELKKWIKQLLSSNNSMKDAAKGFQEQVAANALAVAEQVQNVSTFSKNMSALLPDLMSQQSILTGARAVTISAQQLVLAAKDAQANPLDSNAQKGLDAAVATIPMALNQLQELSDSASSEIIRTIREIQKVLQNIRSAHKQYMDDSFSGKAGASPKAIVENAKVLAKTNGILLSTYGSALDQFVAAVQSISEDIRTLMSESKGARGLTEDRTIQSKLDSAIKSFSLALCGMLECGKTQRVDDPAFYKQFSDSSENCTSTIHELVACAKLLPGGEGLELDDSDYENAAETELQAAINAIEAAKSKLLDPNTYERIAGAFDLEEVASQIVNATMAVAQATQNLVRNATDVQNEIVATGRATSKKLGQVYKKDPAWEEGLISAARAVAGTTEDLVNYANGCVKGECGEEMLVACVRGVGGATARLVSAAKAKADPFSDAHKSLGQSAKSVAEATQGLANATKAAAEKKTETKNRRQADRVDKHKSFAGLRAKELEEQAQIAKLELELERARQSLFQKRRSEYVG